MDVGDHFRWVFGFPILHRFPSNLSRILDYINCFVSSFESLNYILTSPSAKSC
ncbi:hypothetical protein HanPSC8_Chr03g0098221 [Helianthus annuus]|nr:hypothetical protein HanPSC8_Chr03g0098221 [Helianthus annuus]